MSYIGRWTPADFLGAQPENPRALYLSTSHGDPELWDSAAAELGAAAAPWPTVSSGGWAWGSWCYMFRCLQLKQLFGGGASHEEPDRELSRLAALLTTEIRLYHQDALEAVSDRIGPS